MKVIELVKFSTGMLKQLHEFGIKIDDYKYLELYEEYVRMRESHYKTTYVVAFLSDKYKLCERKVYKVIKHFEDDCQNRAV